MRKLTLLAVIALVAVPATALAAPPEISLSTMKSRARSGLGFSYWWGGASWNPDRKSCKGHCSGLCGNCSHWGTSGCPEYGADCSGYTGKVWATDSSLQSLVRNYHPFVARSWTGSRSGVWRNVSDASTRDGDLRANSHHVYFVYNRASNGAIRSTEAMGCAYGIRWYNRSVADDYVTARRYNVSEARPDRKPRKARRPRGPGWGRVGDRLHYCSSARDPEKEKIGYEFRFVGGGRRDVRRTRTVKSGRQMCVTHSFPRDGRYRVLVRAFDYTRRDGERVRQYGPWSEARDVRIADDAARDADAPRPIRAVGGEAVTTRRPIFKWTEVRGPPLAGSNRADLTYEIQVFPANPRAQQGVRPVLRKVVRIGRQTTVKRGIVRWRAPDRARNRLPYGQDRFWWRVRACHWADCTPWSSTRGSDRYGRYASFRVEDRYTGCLVESELPESCRRVFASESHACSGSADCAAGLSCVGTLAGTQCAETCATDADCAAGTCEAASDQSGRRSFCLTGSRLEQACLCDLADAGPVCPGEAPGLAPWTDGSAPEDSLYFREYGACP